MWLGSELQASASLSGCLVLAGKKGSEKWKTSHSVDLLLILGQFTQDENARDLIVFNPRAYKGARGEGGGGCHPPQGFS